MEIPSLEDAWNIGVIVGPSGSGKTTIAKRAFGDRLVDRWDWPLDQSILDGFPSEMGIREITQLLGSRGIQFAAGVAAAVSASEQWGAVSGSSGTDAGGTAGFGGG